MSIRKRAFLLGSRRARAAVMVLVAILGGCGAGASKPAGGAEDVDVPAPKGAEDAPDEKPRALPGVDTTQLTEREQRLWWRLVRENLAPCSEDAVPIAQCVEEARSCAACKPAAAFLAERIRRGDPVRVANAAYAARFTTKPRPVPLDDSPMRGAADAPVTIVVWSDFQCPACGFGVPAIDKALEANPKRARLVHKFYPLKSHPYAEGAARAAIAAMNQGKYWEMEKLLFSNQQALEPADLDRYAAQLGLDMARFHADLGSDKTTAWLARDRAEADALGLDGTPFVFVDGRPFDMSLFRLDEDLGAWIELDAALAQKPASAAVAR